MNADLFLEDVLAGPETLERVLTTLGGPGSPLDDIPLDGVRRVRFVGMGSSRYAALGAAALLRSRGVDAHAERASAALPSKPGLDLLAVCISAGGRSTETVAAAERYAEGGARVVAVANRPSSPLADAASTSVELGAGEEQGGVACRSYTASVALCLLLAGRLTGEPTTERLRRAPEAAASLRDGRSAWLDPALDLLGGTVWCVAPEERLGSAEQGALMLREGPRIAAHASETGDWSHVDVYLTRHPGYRAILFSGSRFEDAFRAWMKRRGAAFLAVGRAVEGAALTVEHAAADEPWQASLAEPIVCELIAAELWRRSLTTEP